MKHLKFMLFLSVLALALLACRAPVGGDAQPSTPTLIIPTAAPATATAEQATAVPPSTSTAPPPATANVTPDEETNGSSPPYGDPIPATPIPSLPTDVTQVVALTGVNMRSGPGLDFIVLDWLVEAEVIEVTGTNDDRTWWEVPCSVASFGRCWITALPQYIRVLTPLDIDDAARVQFGLGSYATTLMNTLPAGTQHRYVLQAAANQKMLLQLNGLESKAIVLVHGAETGQLIPDINSDPRRVEAFLPQTQDYLLEIVSLGATLPYALDVAIVSTTVDPEPIRVVFNPGETSASFNGHVSPFLPIRYLIGAEAGQMMHISLAAELEGANFSLLGAQDGQPYKRLVNSDWVWSGRLPATQDYILSVVVPPDQVGSSYHLSVTIDAEPVLPDVPWIVHGSEAPPAEICAALNPGDLPAEICAVHKPTDEPTPPVAVRSLPSDDAPLRALLITWTAVEGYGPGDGWVKIGAGWVRADQVELNGDC